MFGVICGNHEQYLQFLHLVEPSDAKKNFFEAKDATSGHGRKVEGWIKFGTWYTRTDLGQVITELYHRSLRFRPRE